MNDWPRAKLSFNLIFKEWKSQLCFEKYREAESLVKHRKHCFIDCTGLDWFGLDQGEQDIWWKWDRKGAWPDWEGGEWGGGCLVMQVGDGWGQRGTQPSLRQHKQHADTVTGNIIIIIIILLFKVSLKTSKLYKKEENRFFARMKNTLFVFFRSYKEDSNTRK